MNVKAFCALTALVFVASAPAWALLGVRVSDLHHSPLPPNPVKTWGKVTSTTPLRLSDGAAEVEVSGLDGLNVGDFVTVEGDWNGSVLVASQERRKAVLYTSQAAQLLYVPAGQFLMGNSGNEGISNPEELPQHAVDLPGYWIGKYEITRGEYKKFIEAGGYSRQDYWSADGWAWSQRYAPGHPLYDWEDRACFRHFAGACDPSTCEWGFTQTDQHPQVAITYYEAEAFCNWVNCHLPTEAQWEKAARWSGTPNTYPWGMTWDVQRCNYWLDTSPVGGGEYARRTTPVGSYPGDVSPYGCIDMAGNAWEWAQDWFKSYPGTAYPVDRTGTYRTIRGGFWFAYAASCRCSARRDGRPVAGTEYNGFRLAK